MRPRNPLSRAVSNGDTEAVRAWLSARADVNQKTSGGQTLLNLAIISKHIHILRLLLAAGADPQLRDSLGLNAIDWAMRRGFSEALPLLAGKQHPESETPRTSARSTEHESMSRSLELDKDDLEGTEADSPHSDEKTSRRLAAVKQKFYETQLQDLKLIVPSPAKAEQHILPEKDPSRVTANESHVPTSQTLRESAPSPPVDSSTEVGHVTSEPNSRIVTKEVTTFEADEVGQRSEVSTDAPPSSPHRKRCPKCNVIYDSELLAYCAIDMTPLIDANKPVIVPAPPTPTAPLLWILVGIALFTAVTATYLITRVERVVAPSTSSPQESIEATAAAPVAGGDLAGKELSLPVPEYPSTIRSEGVEGTITVRVKVNSRGRVISARSSDGDARLRAAAKFVLELSKLVFDTQDTNRRFP